jgi:predicted enzyme related to lactoylglutathione lyase
MTSRIAAIAINANDPAAVAEFWAAALGWQVVEEEPGFVSVGAADGSWPTIDVAHVPEGKSVKNRLHLDLRADGSSMAEEVERLIGLGATRVDVGQSSDVTWTVLADPEGNEFCVLSRSVQQIEAEEGTAVPS